MAETVEGKVAGFRENAEEQGFGDFKRSVRVWDFTVEVHDAQGDLAEIVPVQLKGRTFTGLVQEGDDVRLTVPRGWNGADTVTLTAIERLSAVGDQTRSQRIRAVGGPLPRPLMTIAAILVGGLFLYTAWWIFLAPSTVP